MKELTLIIAAKHEAESLPNTLKEIQNIKNLNCTIKVILREEDIKTIEAIKELNCEIIFQDGFGFGNALIAGINATNTKFFCILHADGSCNPAEIPNMLNEINISNNDLIFGSRYQKNSGSEDDTVITSLGNFIFTTLGKLFFKLPISDILYAFILGRTQSAKKLNLKQNDFSFCIELPIKAKRSNMSMKSVSSFERARYAGRKKVSPFKDGFLILKHMIYLFIKK